MTAQIELQKVSKSYHTPIGRHPVLNGISFSLRRGERLGICGLNGAGKSTLVGILGGSISPDSGQVIRRCRVSWPLGFTGGFNNNMTGLENTRFIARIFDADVRRVVAFVQDFAELGKFFNAPYGTYSSGMKARLAFAVSLAIDFNVYLIDEIIGVGDIRFYQRYRDALMSRRERADFIVVSHSLSTLADTCNRFGFLHGGRLEIFDDFDQVRDRYMGLTAEKPAPLRDCLKTDTQGDVIVFTRAEAHDVVDIEVSSRSQGTAILYWGAATALPARMGEVHQLSWPISLLSATGECNERWSGFQVVERDSAGNSLVSDVIPASDGSASEVTYTVSDERTRFIQVGFRLTALGEGRRFYRLSRPSCKPI